jgi:glycerophosphoryl diester phosphodiesterase
MNLPRPALLAHRGASAERPENTLEAFERAVALGADGVETDAHLTRDGAVILAHDDTARRTTGVDAAWSDLDLADVRRLDAGHAFVDRDRNPWRARGCVVPTLDECLRAMPGVFFNVDVKSRRPAMVTAVVSAVREGRAEDRVLLTSFDEDTLARISRSPSSFILIWRLLREILSSRAACVTLLPVCARAFTMSSRSRRAVASFTRALRPPVAGGRRPRRRRGPRPAGLIPVEPARAPRSSVGRSRRRMVSPSAEQHAALDDVLELADVARPGVGQSASRASGARAGSRAS